LNIKVNISELERLNVICSNMESISEKYVRLEVFTAVTMKNAVFSDIKTQFVPHRGNIASPLQSPAC
jgi:hypothetical protein